MINEEELHRTFFAEWRAPSSGDEQRQQFEEVNARYRRPKTIAKPNPPSSGGDKPGCKKYIPLLIATAVVAPVLAHIVTGAVIQNTKK